MMRLPRISRYRVEQSGRGVVMMEAGELVIGRMCFPLTTGIFDGLVVLWVVILVVQNEGRRSYKSGTWRGERW